MNIKTLRYFALILLVAAALGVWTAGSRAQNATPPASSNVPVQIFSPYPITPISATAAAGGATTLTIPTPTQAGYYNYVCYLAMQGGNDNTGTAVSNATGSSTNFNSWANKSSGSATASSDMGVFTYFSLAPPGCVKSIAPTTATTFVSPSSTHEAYTWYATYFQAP